MRLDTLFAELVVEALDVGAQGRRPGLDETEFDASLLCGGKEGPARELGSVVADVRRREFARRTKLLEQTDDTNAVD